MFQVSELVCATSRLSARRNASGRLDAPERRISSLVTIWIAAGASSKGSGVRETEVTCCSMSCCRLMLL